MPLKSVHRFATMISLLLLNMLAPPLYAQAEDDEPAQTPTDLAVLLGNDFAAYNVFVQRSDELMNHSIITQEQCEKDGDFVVFVKRTWNLRSGSTSRRRWVYTIEGTLVEYESASWTQPGESMVIGCRSEDGDFSLTGYRQSDSAFLFPEIIHRVMDVDADGAFETIPDFWLRIALMYHIREENRQFIIRMQLMPGFGPTLVYTVEHVGTEEIKHLGQFCSTHVLTVSSQLERDGQPVMDIPSRNGIMYVLPDGSVALAHWDAGLMGTNKTTDQVICDEQVDRILSRVAFRGNP